MELAVDGRGKFDAFFALKKQKHKACPVLFGACPVLFHFIFAFCG